MTVERTHAGRRVLVTGSGRGVGLAIARDLAARGAEILVNDLAPERAAEAAAGIRAEGGRAEAAAFDVTDWASVRAAAEAAGPVDIVVNNAGNAGRTAPASSRDFALFADTDPADWDAFLDVNLYGVMHTVRAFLPAMVAGSWGRVVTIISEAGRVGEPSMAAYSAAKAGAAGFSRALAREVGGHGVTVNCVSLGTIGPEDPADMPDSPTLARAIGRYVVKRTGRPSEVAAMVAFLTGPQAGWITGQTYPVNGGYAFSL